MRRSLGWGREDALSERDPNRPASPNEAADDAARRSSGDGSASAGDEGAQKSKAATEAAALAEAFLDQLRRGDAGIGPTGDEPGELAPAESLGDEGEPGRKRGKKLPAKLLAQLERRIAELESQVAEAKVESDKGYEARLRLQADFENYRRRSAKEKSDALQHANEDLLKELLPAIDNLERALGASSSASDVTAIAEGVKITYNQILHTLAKFGAEPFSSFGTVFDPQLHDAMTQVESADVPPGHVASEYVKGYRYRDRLLSPAMVAVAKAAGKAEPKTSSVAERVALGGPTPGAEGGPDTGSSSSEQS